MKVFVPHVQRAAIGRRDVIVVEYPGRLTDATRKTLVRQIKTLWPRNRCLILEGGAILKIGTFESSTR